MCRSSNGRVSKRFGHPSPRWAKRRSAREPGEDVYDPDGSADQRLDPGGARRSLGWRIGCSYYGGRPRRTIPRAARRTDVADRSSTEQRTDHRHGYGTSSLEGHVPHAKVEVHCGIWSRRSGGRTETSVLVLIIRDDLGDMRQAFVDTETGAVHGGQKAANLRPRERFGRGRSIGALR